MSALHRLRDRAVSPEALPINIEAEQNVLGALLEDRAFLEQLSGFLKPEHFSEEIHRRTFDIALALHAEAKPVKVGTLITYLGDQDLGGITVSAYLAKLASAALPASVALGMAREVRDLAGRREVIGIGEELVRRARGARPSTSSADLAGETLIDLQRVVETLSVADTRRDAGASAAALVARARSIMNGDERDTGVATGIPELDRSTGGFQPGTLWVIAGRPRMGKTILATGLAKKVAQRGARVIRERENGES